MPKGFFTFLFILLIPFFAGLGHDVYVNYFSDDEKITEIKKLKVDPKNFMVSDIGWIWQEYFPESMENARKAVEPNIWKSNIDPILQLPTMVIGLAPFGLGCVYLLLAFIFGIRPFKRQKRTKKNEPAEVTIYRHSKTKSAQYTKK